MSSEEVETGGAQAFTKSRGKAFMQTPARARIVEKELLRLTAISLLQVRESPTMTASVRIHSGPKERWFGRTVRVVFTYRLSGYAGALPGDIPITDPQEMTSEQEVEITEADQVTTWEVERFDFSDRDTFSFPWEGFPFSSSLLRIEKEAEVFFNDISYDTIEADQSARLWDFYIRRYHALAEMITCGSAPCPLPLGASCTLPPMPNPYMLVRYNFAPFGWSSIRYFCYDDLLEGIGPSDDPDFADMPEFVAVHTCLLIVQPVIPPDGVDNEIRVVYEVAQYADGWGVATIITEEPTPVGDTGSCYHNSDALTPYEGALVAFIATEQPHAVYTGVVCNMGDV